MINLDVLPCTRVRIGEVWCRPSSVDGQFFSGREFEFIVEGGVSVMVTVQFHKSSKEHLDALALFAHRVG